MNVSIGSIMLEALRRWRETSWIMAAGFAVTLVALGAGLAVLSSPDPEGVSTVAKAKLGAKSKGRLTIVAVGGASEGLDGAQALMAEMKPIFGSVDAVVGHLVAGKTGFLARGAGSAIVGTRAHPWSAVGSEGDGLRIGSLAMLGKSGDRLDSPGITFLTKNGVRHAMLALYDPFDLKARRGRRTAERRLALESSERLVQEARKQADVVVVTMAWADEMQKKPTARQRRIARRLVEAGADLVVGHLPRTVLPIEILKVGGRKAVVAFSLGDLALNGSVAPDNAALEVTFAKVAIGSSQTGVVIEGVAYEPLWRRASAARKDGGGRSHLATVAEAARDALGELELLEDKFDEASSASARGVAKKILELQEELRTLALRKERIMQTLEEDLHAGAELKGIKTEKTERARRSR